MITLYIFLTWLLRIAAPPVALLATLVPGARASKLAAGIWGRRGAHRRLAKACFHGGSGRGRPPARPLVWFHAPSVGETLQAKAVVSELKRVRPGIRVVFTHFSPSAQGIAARIGAEYCDYLPWDLPSTVRPTLDALRPSAVVFTRTEVWPVLARELAARGVQAALIAGTVPPDAGRLSFIGRRLLGQAWRSLDLVAAVSAEDAGRLLDLGVERSSATVAGDPGVDGAIDRVRAARADRGGTRGVREARGGGEALGSGEARGGRTESVAPKGADRAVVRRWSGSVYNADLGLVSLPDRPILVAGSTWPPDERLLASALGPARQSVPRLLVIVAPHELGRGRLRRLTRHFERIGVVTATLAELESRPSIGDRIDVVVVERIGVLASLYGLAASPRSSAAEPGAGAPAHAAYVGGGFGRRGLHSVVEPAAAGSPVLFGPRHARAPAASQLLARGAGIRVTDARALAAGIAYLLGNEEEGKRAGRAALDYVRSQSGAARRTAELLAELVGG